MAYPTRVRYGLRLLVRLALQDESRRLSMSEIAQEEGVSIKYLEQIVSLLKPLGFLESVRGAHGGYCLVTAPARIPMDKVFESLGGLSFPVPCFGNPEVCNRIEVCTTRPFWGKLDREIRDYLGRLSLADVVEDAFQGRSEFPVAGSVDACDLKRD